MRRKRIRKKSEKPLSWCKKGEKEEWRSDFCLTDNDLTRFNVISMRSASYFGLTRSLSLDPAWNPTVKSKPSTSEHFHFFLDFTYNAFLGEFSSSSCVAFFHHDWGCGSGQFQCRFHRFRFRFRFRFHFTVQILVAIPSSKLEAVSRFHIPNPDSRSCEF